jgi:RNA polymerase sigma-B factor
VTAASRQAAVDRYVADPTLQNRDALIAAHQYLCRRGARKFYRKTVEKADLEQIATIGLIKACQRYRGAYQTPFEAYAWLMIVGELMHYVRDHERPVRIPRHLRALQRRYGLAYETLTARLEREPRASELAREMGVPTRVVDQLRALRARSANDDGDDGDLSHPSARPARICTISATPSEAYGVEDRLSLLEALQKLSERELRVVREIFFADRTQSEVGRSLGISQRQVSRVLTRTLHRLARMLAA